jgi:TolA-binding protein
MKSKNLLFLLLIGTGLYSYETSAFGAGNLNTEQPYGLTETEQYIYQNKKTINSNEKLLNDISDDVESLKIKYLEQKISIDNFKESINGLQTIVDTEGQKIHKQMFKLQNLNETLEKLSQTDKNFEVKINKIIEDNKKSIDALKLDYNDNITKFKKIIDELSKLINTVNQNYETKENVDILRKDFLHFTKSYKNDIYNYIDKKLLKIEEEQKVARLYREDSDVLYKKGIEFFKAKKFDKSLEFFEILEKRDFKKADILFRLGENHFYDGKYKNAMYYYKKSMDLDEKAKYISKLLYHTGISCLKTGEKRKAIIFFQAVVDQFPDSNDAKLSSKYVKPAKPKEVEKPQNIDNAENKDTKEKVEETK